MTKTTRYWQWRDVADITRMPGRIVAVTLTDGVVEEIPERDFLDVVAAGLGITLEPATAKGTR